MRPFGISTASQANHGPTMIPLVTNVMNIGMAIGALIGILLFLIFGASLVTPLANLTTGLTISHAGGPAVNANLTASPGVTSVLPLAPLLLVGVLFVGGASALGVHFNFDG